MKEGTPEQRKKMLQRKMQGMTPEELDSLERQALALIARIDDSPEGFAAFYRTIHGKDIPDFALEEWVRPLYQAKQDGKGIVIEAFRGSTKTTTITMTFTAYRIGMEPHKSNLLIQVGDDIAQDNTAAIADIIANSAGWKWVFPNIVPDNAKGWGAGGYEVMRNDIDYGEWRAMNSDRKDPTLVGVGYKSREIIGKHPTGVCVIDDIHDENNTSSGRELATVQKILTGTIYPAMVADTWKIFIGTPWNTSDTLHYTASTGEYAHVKTPVIVPDDYGQSEFEGQQVKLAWPARFGIEELRKTKNLVGRREFARMYLLDLEQASNKMLKYMAYPNSAVSYEWPIVGGTDYASNRDVAKNIGGKGDFFAICYLAKLPQGGAVVIDGVLDRVTQAQGETYMIRAQEIFPMWRHNVVESIGKGDDFVQVLLRNPSLKIIPMTGGGKAKAERIERELSPWLENGTIRISDAETPFLNELRRELDNWPNVEHDDALDALYYAARGMPEVFTVPVPANEIREYTRRKRERNPFLSLGRH